MRLDTANRSFYGLLTLAAAPFLLVGLLGCGVLSLTAYRLLTSERTTLATGPSGIAVLAHERYHVVNRDR